MSERRYNDQEIATIFQEAAEGSRTRQGATELRPTLAQLQEIGREAGLAPEAIALAARALDVRSMTSRRFRFGIPVGVSHTVELGRTVSEEEWQRLIARFREVFDAHGKYGADGPTRFWRNGNLRVTVEPAADGHRIRFRSFNENASSLMTMGVIVLIVGAITAFVAATKGRLDHPVPGLVLIGAAGIGAWMAGALRARPWARTRAEQMTALGDEIARPSAGTS